MLDWQVTGCATNWTSNYASALASVDGIPISSKRKTIWKMQQMRFRENWHPFHCPFEWSLWHSCYLYHCSATEEVKYYFFHKGPIVWGYPGPIPLLVNTSRPFSLPGPSLPRHFFPWDLPRDLARLFTSGLVLRPLEFLPRPPMQQNNTKYKYKQKFKHKQKQRSKINTGKYKYKFI